MNEPQYFMNELGEAGKFYLSTGMPMSFDVLETSDAWMISELNAAIQNGIGGVVRITKQQYEDFIKKKSEAKSRNSSPSYRQEISAHLFNSIQQAPRQRGFPGVNAAVVQGVRVTTPELPDPLQVPDPSTFKLPSIGKMPT